LTVDSWQWPKAESRKQKAESRKQEAGSRKQEAGSTRQIVRRRFANCQLSTVNYQLPSATEMERLKRLILWSYSRETSVYVIFCLLIVAFIFLTPKEWFNSRESFATQTSRLIVKQSDFSPDKAVLERRVRELSGNPRAEIVEWRMRETVDGETVYEIDIR
jgi:hypothetical protein